MWDDRYSSDEDWFGGSYSVAGKYSQLKSNNDNSWHTKCLKLVREQAKLFSKDPSTQVGAAIYRPDRTHCSQGYNGYPCGIEDTHDRLKYKSDRYWNDFKSQVMLHAESNAIDTAYESVRGYTIYVWPCVPCPQCAARIINTGISTVVCPENFKSNGGSDYSLTKELFDEAGVKFIHLEID
jgi:dCMP deaminase